MSKRSGVPKAHSKRFRCDHYEGPPRGASLVIVRCTLRDYTFDGLGRRSPRMRPSRAERPGLATAVRSVAVERDEGVDSLGRRAIDEAFGKNEPTGVELAEAGKGLARSGEREPIGAAIDRRCDLDVRSRPAIGATRYRSACVVELARGRSVLRLHRSAPSIVVGLAVDLGAQGGIEPDEALQKLP